MDLTQYVEELRHQLLVAAAAGGDDATVLAERLIAPLDASARLVLLDALSAAAAEITSELAPGSVDVRLRGRDAEFVVTAPMIPEVGVERRQGDVIFDRPAVGEAEDGGTARITLRLPEHLKVRLEEAATAGGLSVNAWLVRAVSEAVDASSADRRPPRSASGGQHYTGWAR